MLRELVVDCTAPEGARESYRQYSAQEEQARTVERVAAQTQIDAQTAKQSEVLVAQSDLASTYQSAVSRLDDIIANGSTYTASQVRTAVIDEAQIMRRLLRLLKTTGLDGAR